jgi:hypothetical protein
MKQFWNGNWVLTMQLSDTSPCLGRNDVPENWNIRISLGKLMKFKAVMTDYLFGWFRWVLSVMKWKWWWWMTMTIFQKHRASSVAKPTYAVPDNSPNETDVFRYQNLWLELYVTPKPVIILVERVVVETILVTLQAYPTMIVLMMGLAIRDKWAGCWYTNKDTCKWPS